MKNSKILPFIKRQEKYHKMGISECFSSAVLYNFFLWDKLSNNENLPPKQRVLKKYSTICKIRVYLNYLFNNTKG